jgi:hypothetical protein
LHKGFRGGDTAKEPETGATEANGTPRTTNQTSSFHVLHRKSTAPAPHKTQSSTISTDIYYQKKYYYIGQKHREREERERERERERDYSEGVKREHEECERVRKWERIERPIFFFVLAFLGLSRFCIQRFYPTDCIKRKEVGPITEGLRGLDRRGFCQYWSPCPCKRSCWRWRDNKNILMLNALEYSCSLIF